MTKPRVVVTGGTGFIAGHIIKQLLDSNNYEVVTTVRSSAGNRTGFLAELAKNHSLTIAEADLTGDEENWVKAFEGAQYVIHAAAVVPNKEPNDPEKEVVQVNVQGTLKVLSAATRVGTVKRVVITSSVSAVADGYPHHTFPETSRANAETWTNLSAERTSYARSKTIAERSAWEYMSNTKPPYDLVSINPGMVVGPLLTANHFTSGEVVQAVLTRRLFAIPDLSFTFVDVRDVAAMHIVALTNSEASGKRFICCGDNGVPSPLIVMAQWLSKEFTPLGYRVPTSPLPSWVLGIVALWDKGVALLRGSLGDRKFYDTTPSIQLLGFQYRSTEEAVVAMGHSLIQYGWVEKK